MLSNSVMYKSNIYLVRTYYVCTDRIQTCKKEQGQGSTSILITHPLFLQKLRYDEGLSSGKMLFYINASVTPNCKWIGHIPFGSHLRGRRTLIHMSHSDCETNSLSWARYHMLLKSYPWWFLNSKITTLLFFILLWWFYFSLPVSIGLFYNKMYPMSDL